MRRYDLVVIGGGTAGLVAAHGAAGIGARVLLAERDRTGGDCLWTGCVPSKALIESARLVHEMRNADQLGLPPVQPAVDLATIMQRVQEAQQAIAPHDSPERLRDAGVDVRLESARFVSPGVVEVGGARVAYRTALVATGSRPTLPPVDGLDSVEPLTSDTVWDLRELPERLTVLGGGPVGCELAQAFARLGSQVTLVDMLPRLLADEEPQASELVRDRLEAEGVTILLGATATAVRPAATGGELVAQGDNGEELIEFDRLLVAVGRTPSTSGLGLDRVGVAVDDGGHVVVDDRMATTGTRIFAAGDVCGGPAFTHVAAYEAGLVVTNALFHLRRTADYERVPWVTFTAPEVARIGLTETQARKRHGDDTTVMHFDHGELDRAVTAARTSGFTKLVADPKGRIVGATIVSPGAGESIAEVAAWISQGGTIDDVGQTVHAYPTFSLALQRAAGEHLRTKWLSPRMRAVARPLLGLLRLVER